MAEPARESAAAQEQARKLDPRKLIWEDVRAGVILSGQAAALAVAELADRPDDDRALAMAERTRQAFENTVELARRWVLDENVLEQVRAEAFEEGFRAGQALRGRLSVVSSG